MWSGWTRCQFWSCWMMWKESLSFEGTLHFSGDDGRCPRESPDVTDNCCTVVLPRFFLPTQHMLECQRKNYVCWGIASIRLPLVKYVGAFSCLMTNLQGPRSLWVVPCLAGGPELFKKAGWASHKREKAGSSVPPWLLLQFLPSGPWPEFLGWHSLVMGCKW